jgi:DivIVA domain-containing protein
VPYALRQAYGGQCTRKWETKAMNGMFWFQLVVIVALLAAVGWLAVGGGGHMSEPMQDRPDLALPHEGLLARSDVDRVRFSVGARGYRMDEVDDVLDRLAHEIDLREQRIAELEGRAPRPEEGEEGGAAADFESPDRGVSAAEGSAAEGSFAGNGAASNPASENASTDDSDAAASHAGTRGINGSVDADPSA